MTDEELKEIEERCEKATPGPWSLDTYIDQRDVAWWDIDKIGFTSNLEDEPNGKANALFISHARTDVPALIAEVRRLREENRKWIPVTERLPEEDTEVLVIEGPTADTPPQHFYFICIYGEGEWHSFERCAQLFPTHWMPLPPPPEREP